MKKRLVGLGLALCMVLNLLPTPAFAEENIEAQTSVCEVVHVDEAETETPVEVEALADAPAEETDTEPTAAETVQAMLDALPTVEELENADEATVNAAYEAAQDAYDALEALNPEEQEQITGVEKLMTLMKWFNEKTSMTDYVYYTHQNLHGIEDGKTYCGDTYFTVDIPAEHLVNVYYYHRASGTYPVLTPDEDGRYKLDAGLGLIYVSVHWDNRTDHGGSFRFHEITINADHADIDKDHNCENGCGKTVGTHEDADRNHICDYGCDEAIGICADADKDHKCDYGCGKNFGTHVDADLNHICDYGCKETIGICADADKDHKCDYGCGKDFGTCEDADKDHKCDYGCGKDFGTCEDADKDHKCDYGCGKTFGVCSGGTSTCKDKAVCDYCGKPYGEVDSNNHDLENIKENAATVTETGNIEYWHCKDCDNNFSDESGKTAIDLKDTVTPKLPPEIIDGQGQSLTVGEKKELTFRSNAAYSDFIRVEVDGETVDEKNYTVNEGSTIVTLNADYIATLSVGEHTLGIVSTNGTATTTFMVNAKAADTDSPKTGDSGHMVLWFGMLAASAAGAMGIMARRRKSSDEE